MIAKMPETNLMETEIMRYLREKEVAELTGLALPTLRNDRFLGRRLPYIKIGKAVRYNESDVIAFMESRKIQTSDSELIQKGVK